MLSQKYCKEHRDDISWESGRLFPDTYFFTKQHNSFCVENGKLFVMGSNRNGELGFGTKTHLNTFTAVPGLINIIGVTSDYGSTLAWDGAGNLYATGDNSFGQLSLKAKNYTTFTQVMGLPSVIAAVTVAGSTYVLVKDGIIYVTGQNGCNQLGCGDGGAVFGFHRIYSPFSIGEIFIKKGRVVALSKQGKLYVVGLNIAKELCRNEMFVLFAYTPSALDCTESFFTQPQDFPYKVIDVVIDTYDMQSVFVLLEDGSIYVSGSNKYLDGLPPICDSDPNVFRLLQAPKAVAVYMNYNRGYILDENGVLHPQGLTNHCYRLKEKKVIFRSDKLNGLAFSTKVKDVKITKFFTLVLLENGELYQGYDATLCDDTTLRYDEDKIGKFIQVILPNPVLSLAFNNLGGLILTTTGDVYAMGQDQLMQSGLKPTGNQSSFVPVRLVKSIAPLLASSIQFYSCSIHGQVTPLRGSCRYCSLVDEVNFSLINDTPYSFKTFLLKKSKDFTLSESNDVQTFTISGRKTKFHIRYSLAIRNKIWAFHSSNIIVLSCLDKELLEKLSILQREWNKKSYVAPILLLTDFDRVSSQGLHKFTGDIFNSVMNGRVFSMVFELWSWTSDTINNFLTALIDEKLAPSRYNPKLLYWYDNSSAKYLPRAFSRSTFNEVLQGSVTHYSVRAINEGYRKIITQNLAELGRQPGEVFNNPGYIKDEDL